MGGLADQHQAGVPDQIEQDVVVGHAVGGGDRLDADGGHLGRTLGGRRRARPDGRGGAHAGPGGQAVVDQDHGLSGELRRWPAVPVGLLAPGQLAALPLGHLLDGLRPDPEAADDVLVEDQRPAAGDRPMATSSWPGTPSLRTRNTPRGAPSAVATS
jgi:hypothetical protein